MQQSKSAFRITFKWIIGNIFSLFLLISCAEIFDLPDLTQAPRIISIDPVEGPEGTEVTIKGLNFSPFEDLNKVRFNGKQAIIIESSATLIKAIVPEDAGSGLVEVVAANKATEGPNFQFLYVPVILSVQPLEGKPGTEVVLTGKYFSEEPGNNLVQFGGKTATVTENDSTESLTVILPVDAVSGPVTVTVNGLTGTGPMFTVLETEQPVHTITGIAPTSGKAGTVVTISGENFSPVAGNNLVKFKDAPADIITASPSKLEVFAPEVGISGIVSLTIAGLIANGPVFTYILDPPVISQLVPDFGYAGDTIEIIGQNFSTIAAENFVKFNGKDAQVLGSTGTVLKAIVPEDAGQGPVTIRVGEHTVTGPIFNYLDNTPTITDFNPKSGPIGTVVVIQGTNFGQDVSLLSVKFNGVEAEISKVENGTAITVTVPQGATTGLISVTLNEKTASSQQNFTVSVASPPLMIVYPSNLRVRENFTIRGTNFSTEPTGNILKIGNINLEITEASSDRLEVYVPDGVSTGMMSLTVNGAKAFFSGMGETTELEVKVNQWASAGDLLEARHGHTATLLDDGRVLVAGGRNTNDFLNSVEIFDPEKNTWTHSGYLHLERAQHTASLLADGKILFIGGYSPIGVLNQCEIYDPNTGISNMIEPMEVPRALHSSVFLDDGNLMVISGIDENLHVGFGSDRIWLKSCEILNLNSLTWSTASSLPLEGPILPQKPIYSQNRYNKAISLPEGQILFIGYTRDINHATVVTCQIYNYQENIWSPVSNFQRSSNLEMDLTLLTNGKVLFVNSLHSINQGFNIFNPKENKWTKLGTNINSVFSSASATLLNNGQVLFAGGNTGADPGLSFVNYQPTKDSSLFDPSSGIQNQDIGNLENTIGKCFHSVTKLKDGTVLLTGGAGWNDNLVSYSSLSSSEIFVPAKQ